MVMRPAGEFLKGLGITCCSGVKLCVRIRGSVKCGTDWQSAMPVVERFYATLCQRVLQTQLSVKLYCTAGMWQHVCQRQP